MWKLRGSLGFMRPVIGAAISFAVVFHLLISGLAFANAVPAADAGETFAICHGAPGDGSNGDEKPVNPLPMQPACVLCTLTHSCGILPTVSAVAVVATYSFLDATLLSDTASAGQDAPQAAQPRGPPAPASIAG
jgi:hypothetical protein